MTDNYLREIDAVIAMMREYPYVVALGMTEDGDVRIIAIGDPIHTQIYGMLEAAKLAVFSTRVARITTSGGDGE